MAYNEVLTDRVRELIAAVENDVEEKAMFSGICFMVNGKMCVGVSTKGLMVRIDPAIYEAALEENGVQPMIMGSRTMKGYVFVNEEDLKTKKQLSHWIDRALAFNPFAQASKKKRK
jgi:TfoX/Sxy family transcriptional regulator of competence genes